MPKLPKQKSTINIIGLGRLGTALAIALFKKRYSIRTLISRRRITLERAAGLLDADVHLLVVKDIKQLQPSDVTLITTPDDQLPQVIKSLSKIKSAGSIALHTSGALSSQALSPLADRGWHVGSVHPLISVSGSEAAQSAFKGAFWCVEGDRKALTAARQLVRDLNGQSFSVRAEVKPLYHAAAVMSSGNVTALFDVAIDMLSKCGLTRKDARKILLPLLESTVENLASRTPAEALTGTFSRGDIGTVERHLAALSEANLEMARSVYCMLGLKSLNLAEQNGLDPLVSKRIKRLLKQ
jgi:predicted short-subunit dehydrogenase-like oxidoreductase (DUF2520 family)